MKRTILMTIMTMCITWVGAMAQKVEEPQFIGDVHALTSDSTVVVLEKKTPVLKTKSGVSMKLTGIGSVKTRMHVEGIRSEKRISLNGNQLVLLVRSANNDNDPTDFIRVFRFEQKKNERRAEMSSMNTFGGASADNLDYIPFSAKKFGESSYLLYFDSIEPCEIGVVVGSPDNLTGKQLVIRCLGVD